MRGEIVLLVRAAITDVRADQDHRGPISLRLRFLDRLRDIFGVVSIWNVPSVPAIRLKTLGHIFGEIDFGGPGERNVILIVETDQLAQLQVPGQRRSLLRDAFHQIAIAANARKCSDRRSCGPGRL